MGGSFLGRARRWSACCAFGVSVLGSTAWAQAPARQIQVQEGEGLTVRVVAEGEAQAEGGIEAAIVVAPKLWIGLVLEPVNDVVRSQLNLPAEAGLVVREVIPDSPAAAAGVQQFDILLSVNGTQFGGVRELIHFVEHAGPFELTLQIIRHGEQQELKLTPTERPEAMAVPAGAGGAVFDGAAGPGVQWLQLAPQYRVYMAQPGQIVARAAVSEESALPEDVHVVLRKHGAEPTVVVVERGTERWEVELSKLDELPEDIRAQVTTYMHSLAFSGATGGAVYTPTMPVPPIPEIPIPRVVPFPGRAFPVPLPPGAPPSPEIMQRLDELQRQLEQLRERIDSQERESADRPDGSGVRSSFISFRCA